MLTTGIDNFVDKNTKLETFEHSNLNHCPVSKKSHVIVKIIPFVKLSLVHL